ncbi:MULTISPECIES: acetoin utilization AcuB family protein [Pontibacillus]|uniref:Acetoin utilization AcuB family protein n=1 Tax=Pontibacillus chungwhensis TaxID=265426 RepID=A0ABY8UXM0_9BACI|nr:MULTISPECIES: acetoin utilization AcuB family protein [Pontibacillus]MCD5323886.1 acetoin utilization AcuB family protein [Pontibacillus sp. HN14]WIF97244.1 acetoin utilization AcuB family protein [Pontibacillus chungwhensis]
MLVEEVMKTEVISLRANETIETALKLLNDHHIRHIPIVDEHHHVIGIVSDRDVRDASPSVFQIEQDKEALQNTLESIMSSPVITAHPLDFVEEIASIFYEHEIACVPVTKANKLVGIITEKDMLYTMIQLTGVTVQSSQIEIKVIDKPGILPEVTAVLGRRKTNITSVLIYPYQPDSTYKVLVFRLQTMNPMPVIEDLKAEGYEVLWPNMPGMEQ